jgi:hypothetical protein
MNEIDPQALFRFSVLGPLISRRRLARGELQRSCVSWPPASTSSPAPTGALWARRRSRGGITATALAASTD